MNRLFYKIIAITVVLLSLFHCISYAIIQDSLHFSSKEYLVQLDSLIGMDFEKISQNYNANEALEDNMPYVFNLNRSNLFYYLSQNNSRYFHLRGVSKREHAVYINGMKWENFETNSFEWSSLANMYQVFDFKESKYGLETNSHGNMNLGTAVSLNNYAGLKDKESGVYYAISNANFQHSIAAYHHSGILKNQWSVSLSLSKRWANESYIEGNSYDGYGFYLGVSKKLRKKHFLHFTALASPYKSANNSAITEELVTILDNPYYNPNWGWQNGKKRSANEVRSFTPMAMLNYDYTINSQTQLFLSLGYQQGIVGNSNLEWYNAQDPRPDYYKNLPSYYMHSDENNNDAIAAALLELWQNDTTQRQINWYRFYEVNQSNIDSEWSNSQKRSLYILGEQKRQINNFRGFAQLNRQLNNKIHSFFGIQASFQKQENYKEINDLLGGDYYLNLNQFAEQVFVEDFNLIQNNLLDHNPIKRKDEKYDYHYFFYYKDVQIWMKWLYEKKNWSVKFFSDFKYVAYQREGKYQNGLYANDSYGKSKLLEFLSYTAHLNTNYKFSKNQRINLNTFFKKQAPTFTNVFIAPKYRNTIANKVELEEIYGFDLSYMYYSPKIHLSVQYFNYEHNNQLSILRFYHEGYRSFVNYVMSGIDTRNLGLEFAMQVRILPPLKMHILGMWQQVFYTSKLPIQVYRDNDTTNIIKEETVFLKNYYKGVGPQSFYNLGLTYSSMKFGFLQINGNFLHRNYIEKNPNALTPEAIELIDRESKQFQKIIEQKELPYSYNLNMQYGKILEMKQIWNKLPQNLKLKMHISVYNILNTKNILQAYPQLRFDFTTKNADKFPEKFYYDYGRTFTLGISIMW